MMPSGLGSRRIAACLVAVALTVLVSPVMALAAPLPPWPTDFGPERSVADADHAVGFTAVAGPDGRAWCFVSRRAGGTNGTEATIAVIPVTREANQGTLLEVARTTGEITAVAAAADESGAVVAWAEKVGDEYCLKSSRITVGSDGTLIAGIADHLLDISSVLSGLAVSLVDGSPLYAWIDQEEGRPSVFIGRETGTGKPLTRIRVSRPDRGAQRLRMSSGGSVSWLTWVEADGTQLSIECRAYREGSLQAVIELDQGSADAEGASVVADTDATAHVVYTVGAIVRGERSTSLVAYARVGANGTFVDGPRTISGSDGFALSPGISLGPSGPLAIWSLERGGRVGIAWGPVSKSPADPGNRAVTYSTKDCLHPLLIPLPDGALVALYQKYVSASEIRVYAASSLNPRQPDWRYYLGLDLDSPVRDALFTLVMVIATAGVITVVSIPLVLALTAVVSLADRLGVFSQSRLGGIIRLLFMFSLLFLIKSPGAWYYGYVPALPVGLAWLSFGLSALASLVIAGKTRLSGREWMHAALLGALYVMFDALFTVIQTGVNVI